MIEYFIILIVCIIGVGYTSWKLGVQEGSEKMVEMLENIGIITIDDYGNVVPNKEFKPIKRKI